MTDPQAQPVELVECPSCGASVLPRRHCSVCGHPLAAAYAAADAATHPATHRATRASRSYAADPSEPALALRLVSTLLPQLPRADMNAFRVALVAGTTAVVLLAALGYLPVALVSAAFLVPLLLTVYLYSVDVYEDEPLRVILVTLAWGAVTGALFGLALRELFPARIGPGADDPVAQLLRVVVLPMLGFGALLLGPLAMLRFPKFNDVLDGATFGAVAGATFVGAQVIAQSIDLVTAGLEPGGDTWSWVLRIVEHGVLMPVIAGGAAAGVCGAFWLRYRAPSTDLLLRLPPLAVAVGIAGILVIGANAALVLTRDLPRLALLLALAGGALVWLRLLVDLGLRQEAREAAIADPLLCPNCGRITAPGSFCTECGISLRALPKRPPPPHSGAGAPRGAAAVAPLRAQPSRLDGRTALIAFLAGLAVVTVVMAVIVIVLAPRATPPCPDPTRPCPVSTARGAPAPASTVDQEGQEGFLRFGETVAGEPGWQLDFDPRWWTLDETDPTGVRWLSTGMKATTARGTSVTLGIFLRLEVVPVAQLTPGGMLSNLDQVARSTLESVTVRDDHGSRLLAPHIGYVPGVGRTLVGDFGTEGALTPYGAYLLAASDGASTAGILLYVSQPDETFPFFSGSARTTRFAGDLLDDVLKRFYWPGAAGALDPDDQGTPTAALPREDGSRGMLPEELRRAYGIDALHAQGLRGQGQVIALIQFDTFLESDLAAWDARTGTVGGPVEKVEVEGPMTLGSGAVEVNLDIQTVRAIAPEATIIDFESNWSGSSFAPAIEAILADGRADIASMSWGYCEAHGDVWPELAPWFEGMIGAEDEVYTRLAASGVTLFASSGDEGVYNCVRLAPEASHHLVAANYPASHPSVVSVGGTYQWRELDGAYDREATWTGPMSGEASGGGPSRFFDMPQWQLEHGLGDRSAVRLTPDVAGPADPDSGILSLYTPMQLVGEEWEPVATCSDGVTPPPCQTFGGGTSQAAPFWAGVMALIRQGAEEQGILPVIDGRPRLPFLSPLLYRIAREEPDAFRDITAGSNLLEPAGPAWDPATGLGTPNVAALAEAIWAQLRDAAP